MVSIYRSQIDELIEQIFEGMEITESIKSDLLNVLQISTKSNQVSGRHTGIVIAGFGDKEIFPSLFEIVVDGVIGKSLKFNLQQRCHIGIDTDAVVIPFAQGEMVNRFMEGIDPEFLEYLYFTTESILKNFGENILNEINLDNNQYYESVEESSIAMMQIFHNRLVDFRQAIFIQPITQIIRHLPKDELGGMAETLVNLTSLKRRVSFELETVGGPVDVAIISKGDGLIWRKRKHYFDTTLNPDYFNRQEI